MEQKYYVISVYSKGEQRHYLRGFNEVNAQFKEFAGKGDVTVISEIAFNDGKVISTKSVSLEELLGKLASSKTL